MYLLWCPVLFPQITGGLRPVWPKKKKWLLLVHTCPQTDRKNGKQSFICNWSKICHVFFSHWPIGNKYTLYLFIVFSSLLRGDYHRCHCSHFCCWYLLMSMDTQDMMSHCICKLMSVGTRERSWYQLMSPTWDISWCKLTSADVTNLLM